MTTGTKARASWLAACSGLAVLLFGTMGAPLPATAAATALVTLCVALAAGRAQARQAERRARQHQGELRLREERLAHTAHELRTPLTAVTTALELLREGYATTAEDWQGFVDQASVAARHMAFLISDVVDLAALECGQLSLHIKPHAVREMFFDVAQVMHLTAQSRGVDLRIEEPDCDLRIATDRGRFLQVVFNLLANAIKFSEPRKLVRMTTRHEGAAVVVEVHDDGPGIDPALRERLFTRFGRFHERSMPSVAGSGLGLHVCKLLVEYMGGHIGYRPGSASGSVFWFRLPRHHADCAAPDGAAPDCGAPDCGEPVAPSEIAAPASASA